jgi:hypothetical protein
MTIYLFQKASTITQQNYEYDDLNFDNDIALLKLDTEVTFTDTIRPVCLMKPNEMQSNPGDEGYVRIF